MIKAIETQYRGHRFRSRLEARYAVFFDSVGIRWQYELEGFRLPTGGGYLPDFYLPDLGGIYLEIKPDLPYAAISDCNQIGIVHSNGKDTPLGKFILASQGLEEIDSDGRTVNMKVFMACGTPGLPRLKQDGERWKLMSGSVVLGLSRAGMILMYAWCEGADGVIGHSTLYEEGNIPFSNEVKSTQRNTFMFPAGLIPSMNIGTGRKYNSERIISAYTAAKSARFEFGETPK